MCLDYRPSSVSHPKRPLHLWAWSNPNTYWEVFTLSQAPLTAVSLRTRRFPFHSPIRNWYNSPVRTACRRIGTRHRSTPPNPPIPLQLPPQKRLWIPSIRRHRLACWRHFQNLIFLFRRSKCDVAVQDVCCCTVCV